MLPLAHLAAGYFAAVAWNRWMNRQAIRPWLCAFGGILPDLMDKSMAWILPGWEGTSRTIGHTFAFFVLLVILARGYSLAPALALGVFTHLMLDLPWTYFATFLWPLLGPEFTPGSRVSVRSYLARFRDPSTLISEALGGILLVGAVAWHHFAERRKPPLALDRDD